ncbi:hypothetical protein [Microbispora bryophytorum]|uniref:hypothetical protein n=1 Tax=Microbispora bryophytorum TaxID=1460882 RepID=UPI0033CAEFDD
MTDIWYQRDLPVLQAIVRLKDENPGAPIPRKLVEEATDLDAETVRRAVFSLMDEPYIETDGSLADMTEDIKRVTGDGKRAANFWPTPESLADVLRDAILQAAEREPDEGKRGKLRALGTWLAEGGRDIVTGVISSAITGG